VTAPATGHRVSVVVPVRNGERYLQEAIDSILGQDPPVEEVIVIDDGSQDGSAALAAAIGDPVRCISQPPRGIGAARNRGFAECRGEFVAVLDADDLWVDGALALWLEAFAAEPELEVVFGHVRQFFSPDIDAAIRSQLVCPPGLAPARMPGGWLARRSALDRVGPFREDIVSGDMIDWLIRAEEAGIRDRLLPEQVVCRRIHADNHGRHQRSARSDYARVLKAALDRRRAEAQADS
jgi:glycosyltransferase involved in cell wall biosynthesis